MSNKTLWLLIEGYDDKNFVEKVITPSLKNSYDDVRIYEYAQKKNSKVAGLIKSVKSMPLADYFFITDINKFPVH